MQLCCGLTTHHTYTVASLQRLAAWALTMLLLFMGSIQFSHHHHDDEQSHHAHAAQFLKKGHHCHLCDLLRHHSPGLLDEQLSFHLTPPVYPATQHTVVSFSYFAPTVDSSANRGPPALS